MGLSFSGERPIDRFQKERQCLRKLPAIPFDTDEVLPVLVTPKTPASITTATASAGYWASFQKNKLEKGATSVAQPKLLPGNRHGRM